MVRVGLASVNFFRDRQKCLGKWINRSVVSVFKNSTFVIERFSICLSLFWSIKVESLDLALNPFERFSWVKIFISKNPEGVLNKRIIIMVKSLTQVRTFLYWLYLKLMNIFIYVFRWIKNWPFNFRNIFHFEREFWLKMNFKPGVKKIKWANERCRNLRK